jgi:hypothetical protein
MARAGITALTATNTPPLPARLAKWLRDWAQELSDPYRPELHYMRGPGPRWRERQGQTTIDVPSLSGHDICQVGG